MSDVSNPQSLESGRPDYPVAAVEWLVGHEPQDLLELVSGTGKLTRVLLELGHKVTSFDPDPEMLNEQSRHLTTPMAVARAEQIPLPSRSVDMVVCAQSFDQFDQKLALPEITRVLRPGGRLALVWNVRDLSVPWVRKLSNLIGVETHEGLTDSVIDCPTFAELETAEFKHWQTHTSATLSDLVKYDSDRALPVDELDALISQVRALYDSYGRGPDGLKMPFTTHAYRARVQHLQAPPTPYPEELTKPAGLPTTPDPASEDTIQVPLPPEDPGTVLVDFH